MSGLSHIGRISIVMTSNINDLVSQTHFDFARGLPGVVIFTKDNDLDREVPRTRPIVDRADQPWTVR